MRGGDWKSASAGRRRQHARRVCSPDFRSERPVFPAGSLAACEGSHEAVLTFVSVGSQSELTAYAVDAVSFENGEWLHNAGWRGVRSFASSG